MMNNYYFSIVSLKIQFFQNNLILHYMERILLIEKKIEKQFKCFSERLELYKKKQIVDSKTETVLADVHCV